MKTLRLLVLALLLPVCIAPAVSALEVPPKPTASPVVDNADILTPEQEQQLAAKITDAEKSTGNQVAVLTIPTLDGEVIEEYALAVARGWGVGSAERDSGVLLVAAIEERKLRIEVGYGLEGALPDIRAGQIIRDRIAPSFAKRDYNAGLNNGVDGILLAIRNEKDPNLKTGGSTAPRSNFSLPWELILFALFFIPSWMAAILGRSKRWWPGGVLGLVVAAGVVALVGLTVLGIAMLVVLPLAGLLFDRAVSRNFQRRLDGGMAPSWWAGGTFFGGGGHGSDGGFGGFGGGGFGGGGASGDW